MRTGKTLGKQRRKTGKRGPASPLRTDKILAGRRRKGLPRRCLRPCQRTFFQSSRLPKSGRCRKGGLQQLLQRQTGQKGSRRTQPTNETPKDSKERASGSGQGRQLRNRRAWKMKRLGTWRSR